MYEILLVIPRFFNKPKTVFKNEEIRGEKGAPLSHTNKG